MVYRILTINGGGIRGAASARFLSRVEADYGQSLFAVFDYFAGTSTGALIALHMAVNKASAADCYALYNPENAREIFDASPWDRLIPLYLQNQPKYDGKGKNKVLKRVFGQKRIKSARKPVLVTAYDLNDRQIVVFKSDGGSEAEYNPYVHEVADASTAAPLYFPTVESSHKPAKWLLDGGVAANNPSICALAEALKKGINPKDIRLVSVGTGTPNRGHDSPDETGKASQHWGGMEWIKSGLIDHIFAGNMGAADYICKQILGKNYIYVNSALKSASDDMDDVSNGNLDQLEKLGDRWFVTHGRRTLELLK